jgi:Nucleoside-diphosphate-sugar epimerases
MGGTRFVGKPLVSRLLQQGHQLTLFTRGRQPLPAGVESCVGDRQDDTALEQLRGRRFEVVIDSSGRTLADSQKVIERTGAPSHRFLYVSSSWGFTPVVRAGLLMSRVPWIQRVAMPVKLKPRLG